MQVRTHYRIEANTEGDSSMNKETHTAYSEVVATELADGSSNVTVRIYSYETSAVVFEETTEGHADRAATIKAGQKVRIAQMKNHER